MAKEWLEKHKEGHGHSYLYFLQNHFFLKKKKGFQPTNRM